jgi:hypothetical protein
MDRSRPPTPSGRRYARSIDVGAAAATWLVLSVLGE